MFTLEFNTRVKLPVSVHTYLSMLRNILQVNIYNVDTRMTRFDTYTSTTAPDDGESMVNRILY